MQSAINSKRQFLLIRAYFDYPCKHLPSHKRLNSWLKAIHLVLNFEITSSNCDIEFETMTIAFCRVLEEMQYSKYLRQLEKCSFSSWFSANWKTGSHGAELETSTQVKGSWHEGTKQG